LLLVPPAALADPRALTHAARCATLPAGLRKRTGKGQRRTPSRASRPADDSSAEEAVIAVRTSARATRTANRNTPASVRHRPPRPQRVFTRPRDRLVRDSLPALGNPEVAVRLLSVVPTRSDNRRTACPLHAVTSSWGWRNSSHRWGIIKKTVLSSMSVQLPGRLFRHSSA
jgi:hypothetical protein